MDRPAKNRAKDKKARGDFSRVLFLSQRFVFFGARKAGGVLPTEGGERGASLAPHSANTAMTMGDGHVETLRYVNSNLCTEPGGSEAVQSMIDRRFDPTYANWGLKVPRLP